MKKISILVPTNNEQEALDILYKRLDRLASDVPNYDFEFLFVNDDIRERTAKIVRELADKDPRISYVNLSKCFGRDTATRAGFDYATGDAVVIIDVNMIDPPELVPEMIKNWEKGYDNIYVRRVKRKTESNFKKAVSAFHKQISNKPTSVKTSSKKCVSSLRLLDRKCVNALKQLGEVYTDTDTMYDVIGYKSKEVTYARDSRAVKQTKVHSPKRFILPTARPLKVSAVLGLVIAIVSFALIAVSITKMILINEPISNYPITIAIILFIGGIQLISVGIVGEYVGKIFNETKQRPLYFVKEYHSGKSANKAQ